MVVNVSFNLGKDICWLMNLVELKQIFDERVYYAGKRLCTIPIGDATAKQHLKTVADKKTISIWNDDKFMVLHCLILWMTINGEKGK